MTEALHHLGEDLCSATDLRARIRRHPFLAVSLGAGLGFVGGPALVRAVPRLLGMASGLSIPGLRPPFGLPGIVLASLRGMSGSP